MAKFKVSFKACIQDSQEAQAENPNRSHMISRVIFDLEVDDYVYVDMIVDLKQPFGTDYATEPA